MHSLWRILFVIPQAALITFFLLVLMVSFIELADPNIQEKPTIKLPDIYMVDREIQVKHSITKPEKPKIDITPLPEIPQQDFDKIAGNVAVGTVAVGKIAVSLDLDIGKTLQAIDGEYLPIVKVAPQYPRHALNRGIEGHVTLEYTVTKQGTVIDPKIIESQPQGIFDKVAIKSALRYKYKPRVIDGQPIAVSGVRTKITFVLEQ